MSTTIRIKRSSVSGNPPVLAAGELAYSALPDNGANGGDRLYIGSGTETGGNAASHLVIGGVRYTTIIDAATTAATPSTLVMRDGSGSVTVNQLIGNAQTASKLVNARHINLTGPVTGTVLFDGSGDVNIATAFTASFAPTFAGGTFTGVVNMSGYNVQNLADPVNPQDAATKAYVDASRSGLNVKQSVRVATTGSNLAALSGLLTIDGITLVAGDRVLVKDQTDQTTNGIYVAAAGGWTRSTDANSNTTVTPGMFTFVLQGTLNSDQGFVLATTGAVTLGTTTLIFTQFSGTGDITAGTGITKTGNTLSISTGYAGQASIVTLGTVTTGTWQATAITVPYGGTGLTSYNVGDVLVASSSSALSTLGIGASGKVLQSNGTTLVYGDVDGGTY